MLFKDVIGHGELKHHLVQEVKRDKIAQTQLFSGKMGYGTLPLALAFIQYVFCENKSESDSCGQCSSCKKVTDLQHPDLHFFFPVVQAISKVSSKHLPEWREQIKENPYFDLYEWTQRIDDRERKPIISAEESQEIIRKTALKSYEGGYKVYVIWMAEEMNSICANKLLKILEEPPEKSLFLLLCESIDGILPTILSRTQIVPVPRIPDEELVNYLVHKTMIDAETAQSFASFSEGNYLTAIQQLKQQENIDFLEFFKNLMRSGYKKDVNAMLDWAEEAAQQSKEKQKLFVVYALHLIRQSILMNYTPGSLVKLSQNEADFLKNFAKFINGKNIQSFMQTMNDIHYHLERNANPRIVFTHLTFQVMRYIHV
jgi:DNA polymerase-3 subunit delta'